MDDLNDQGETSRIDALYVQARKAGRQFVTLLDVCFDGGDSVDDAAWWLAAEMSEAATDMGIDAFFDDAELV